ncbi:DUF7537 family lipoprotein [Halorubellus litoreus]|uniref:Outer membrane lipoprotein-sorting protein n=1 Tax=Halorubellus litoreus TaxID=755308 RepID=A0ABD5V806_9EURY
MDTSRTLLVVAVVAMVALAGCSGGQTTSTAPTANGTTDPGTTTGTDGGDGSDGNPLEGIDTAPWMTGNGVNGTRLLSAHFGSLSGTSYRVETAQNSSGLLSLQRDGVQRVAENGDTIYEYDTRTSRGNSTTRAFVNDTWVLTETANDTRTVYSDYRVDGSIQSLNYTEQLVQYVRLGNFTVNRTYQVDGETRIEYVASGPSSVQGAQAITSFDGRFVVNPDGRLYELSVAAVQEAQYGNATTEFEFELAKVGGVDASTPAWVSTARQQATTVDFDYEYNGSVLKITHEGGDTVAAGTQVVITPQVGRGVAYTTLPANFSAGETIYVTAAGGRQLNVSFEPVPKPETGIGGAINLAMYGSNGEVVMRTGVGPTANASTGVVAPVGEPGIVGDTGAPIA